MSSFTNPLSSLTQRIRLNAHSRQQGVWEMGRRLVERERAPVCPTPYTVVENEGCSSLMYFAASTPTPHPTPIFISTSLINRYYILDLMDGKSLIAYLTEQGHDVYCVDWGSPSYQENDMGFDDYIAGRLNRFVNTALLHSKKERVHLFGHCLGGTIGTMLASVDDSRFKTIVNLTTPISFIDDGMLSAWTRAPFFDPKALTDAFGDVPSWLSQPTFMSLRPMGVLTKWLRFYQQSGNQKFLDFFHCMETWTSDNVPIPKKFYVELIDQLYRKNSLYEGSLELAGIPVLVEEIEVPVFTICARTDHIVPLKSAQSGHSLYHNPKSRLEIFSGGHIGVVIGGKARHSLWPQLSDWFQSH